jgi:cytochrome c553
LRSLIRRATSCLFYSGLTLPRRTAHKAQRRNSGLILPSDLTVKAPNVEVELDPPADLQDCQGRWARALEFSGGSSAGGGGSVHRREPLASEPELATRTNLLMLRWRRTANPVPDPGEREGVAGRARHAAAAAALSGFLLVAHGTAAGDAAAGARLAAARCASCHSSMEPMHSTLPLLEGQPKAAFKTQWRAFRERKRSAPVMVSLAQELSEQDVEDLADHYSALLPPRALEPSGSDAGRALTDRLRCADCHGPALQGTNAGAARLAGQRARYTAWSLQLMRGGSRSHGTAATPDPLLAELSNAEIESLAAHLASLR